MDKGVVVYIDDILIHSRNRAEQDELVSAVFEQLQQVGLAVKPNKCHFSMTRVNILGSVISTEAIVISRDKGSAIAEGADLRSLKYVYMFMRFANFYCGFIENFCVIMTPITDTLEDNSNSFKITNKYQEAFGLLKRVDVPLTYMRVTTSAEQQQRDQTRNTL